MAPDPIEAGFERFAGNLDYPMFVVTAASGERRAGCLVGFTSQCSVSPPLFAVFLSNKNLTYRVAGAATHLGVHVVPAERRDLAELFGHETGEDVDKFERCEWEPGPGGAPRLTACPDGFTGQILERFESGDHAGFILAPVEVTGKGDSFLAFQDAKDIEPGHEA